MSETGAWRARLAGAFLGASAALLPVAAAHAGPTWGVTEPAQGAAADKLTSLIVLPFTVDGAIVDGELGKPQEAADRKAEWPRALQKALVKSLGGRLATPAGNLVDRTGLALRGEVVRVEVGSGSGPYGDGYAEVTVYAELFDASDPVKTLYGFLAVADGRAGSGDPVERLCRGALPGAVAKAVRGAAKARLDPDSVARLGEIRVKQGRGGDSDEDDSLPAPVAPGASEATGDDGEVVPSEGE